MKKILIIQLARFGDIFQTIPAIHAYKRVHPEHELHLLVRARFATAAEVTNKIDRIIPWNTQEILSPLIKRCDDITSSLYQIENELAKLAAENYDEIINLSFSPLSSWITGYLYEMSAQKAIIKGYQRTSDGYLAIPDDTSAYFYAQVGQGKPNRFHLTDVFASVLGLELAPADFSGMWEKIDLIAREENTKQPDQLTIGLHARASQVGKSLELDLLTEVIDQSHMLQNSQLVLFGGRQDESFYKELLRRRPQLRAVPAYHDLNWKKMGYLLKSCDALIAVDSALQNLASLTQTPTLLISRGLSKFWETGPRAPRSVILAPELAHSADHIAHAIDQWLKQQPLNLAAYYNSWAVPCYQANFDEDEDFRWQLCEFIYRAQALPRKYSRLFLLALQKLEEANQFYLEMLEQVKSLKTLAQLKPFFERADEIIDAIYQLSPDVQPIIDWLKTEKVRIPPGSVDQVYLRTYEIHQLLAALLEALFDDIAQKAGHSDLKTDQSLTILDNQ